LWHLMIGETEHMEGHDFRAADEAGLRILVVDDEQIILDLLKRVLSREGYRVSTVLCSDEAMIEVCTGRYDVAIADVGLYCSDGRELMNMIGRASPGTAVVLMTGYAEDRIVRFAQEHAHGLLEKPFALEELLATVRIALESRVEDARRSTASTPVGPRLQAGVQA
jgi:DNA-binding NtrC family response regulator